jgi:hypothetical protein
MATRRKFIQVTSAAGAALFIRGAVAASAEEDEVKKLPMMTPEMRSSSPT